MYAVMVTGVISAEQILQTIIAPHNSNIFCYSRTTNGKGRGEQNAWKVTTYSDIARNNLTTIPLLGDVVATALTQVDIDSMYAGQVPQSLTQKLTKLYSRRDVKPTTLSVQDIFVEIDSIIKNNPSDLVKYHSDLRWNKQQDKTERAKPMATKPITKPVIQIVHDDRYSDKSLSFIPSLSNPELANYVVRKFANGLTETDVYDYALANKQNVAIVGGAGTGKTTSTMHYAGLRGLRYYRVNFHAGVEPSVLFGKLMPANNGELVWQDGGFTECWRNGNALIHLDEIGFINNRISGSLFPPLDSTRTLTLIDNKGEIIPAGENLLIVASYNEGYRGNNKLNEAFADRFTHKLIFDYDPKVEQNFIKSPTLIKLATQMRNDSIAGLYETPISTRLLKNFQEFATQLGYDYAVDNFVNNFSADEKQSVKLLLDAHRHNLELELTNQDS
mgnify:CR=1 FL=1